MWANIAVIAAWVTVYEYVLRSRFGAGTVLVALLVTAAALAALVVTAHQRRRRWLRRRPLLDAVVANRSAVVAYSPAEAFDAALRAMGALRRARLDAASTSFQSGTVTATTAWSLLSIGERIDVRLYTLDDAHVVVVVDVATKYRGPRLSCERVTAHLVRFFAALPVDRPYAWS
jgi:hypothetical protein